MLTPDDIQKKMFSLGRKLENNDVGIFVKEVQINYQLVYDQVLEQEKQIKGMEKKLKYYRDVEGSLQDALVHAEKVSDQKIKESQREAERIEEAAHKKAEDIIADAKSELVYLKSIIKEFEHVYENYQDKYKDFIQGQLEFINNSKQFMEKEKIHVKKFVSNIDVEDYSAGSLNNEKKQEQFRNKPNFRDDDSYSQKQESHHREDEMPENDDYGKQNYNKEIFDEVKDDDAGFRKNLEYEDDVDQIDDVDDEVKDAQDYDDEPVGENQESEEKNNTFTFGKVMNEQEIPIDNQSEVVMDTQAMEEDIEDDADEEMVERTTNIDDMFTLPEIDMDSLDFSSLNFNSSPQGGGVDFNSTLNSATQINDMPIQDEEYSYDQEFKDNSGYNYDSQNDYSTDSLNNVDGIDETTKSVASNLEVDDDLDNRVPDLSQNANVELKFANDSFFGKKKKPDGKEKVLQGLNLGGSKADEKARIRQLENSYAQNLLNANKQVAERGPIESDVQNGEQQSTSRNYGPANYNPENKGLASKPLNPSGQEQQRRSLFSMPGDK